MPNKIVLKKSSVASKVPVAGDLDFGELAINYTDGKLYFKKADNSIDAFTTAAASAPVTSVGGNIGDITDAQLLASIKNVDGTGSGLDADTLDGNHASAFYLASNPNGYTSNTGTVTSVGATAPLVSSGGTAPSISIPAANSTTNGYMSSAYAAKLDGIAAGATNVTNTNQLTNGAGYITSAALVNYFPISGGSLTTGASNNIFIGRNSTATNYNAISLNGNPADSSNMGLTGGGVNDNTLYINSPGNIILRTNSFGQSFTINSNGFSGNAASATTLQNARTINGISFNGSANIDTTEWFHSDRDFASGTLITTNINYAVSSGDPFVLEIKGNSYGDIIPYDIQYQGYIYSDTIINHGGYSNGVNISGLVALNVGGNLCFWFPRQSYWNGFNVKVYTAYATRAVNRVTSITSTAKPSGTKEVSLSANIRQSLHSSNYTSYTMARDSWNGNLYFNNDGRIYSTIMYDSNDSGYYIDPNGTSNLSAVNIAGALVRLQKTHSEGGEIRLLNTASTAGGYIQGWDSGIRTVDHNWSTTTWSIDNAGNSIATASHRAPVFYDSNDSGYYCDPNGNSRFNRIDPNEIYNYGWFRNHEINEGLCNQATGCHFYSNGGASWGITGSGGNVELQFRSNHNSTIRGYVYGDTSSNFGLLNQNGSWKVRVNGSDTEIYDYMYFNNGRGYIFYDRNDTGYYCDPNGTSRLNSVNSNNHYIQPGYMLYSDHGSWTGEYNKIQWHAGHLYFQNAGGGYLAIFRRGDGGERGWIDYNGNASFSGNVTAYSDARLKTNVVTIQNARSLRRKLRGVTFDWIKTGEHSYGLIAQEVEKYIPELVLEVKECSTDPDSRIIKTVDYSKLVSVLIQDGNEQDEIIDSLQDRIEKLEELVNKLIG